MIRDVAVKVLKATKDELVIQLDNFIVTIPREFAEAQLDPTQTDPLDLAVRNFLLWMAIDNVSFDKADSISDITVKVVG